VFVKEEKYILSVGKIDVIIYKEWDTGHRTVLIKISRERAWKLAQAIIEKIKNDKIGL